MMRIFKLLLSIILIVVLTSCGLLEDNYEPIFNVDIPECTGETLNRFGLSDTAGLIEYGYDVPVFDGEDEAGVIICEDNQGKELWFFHTKRGEEETIIELDDFFLDIDYIITKAMEYNDVNEVDIDLHNREESFSIGDLDAGGMLESDLSAISKNLLFLEIGSMEKESDSFNYFVRVVKLLDGSYQVLAVEHSGDEYLLLFEINE